MTTVAEQVDGLKDLPLAELRTRFEQVYGGRTRPICAATYCVKQ